ncbi:unnamed protein product [Gongylonema pulchrum]|uniref:ABC transmembrane type-1 domain-containing protein n=1 Tax=Gongylonema pulchrum TaxID=637853 RepID=A0A183CVS5_9BILA|nr:unnamed protein product [Gongylonema pulchrum]
MVANKRMKSFLVADELNPETVDRSPNKSGLIFNLHLWIISVKLLNFTIPKRALVAVVGKVGSGKSTLICAILGEMEKLQGYIGVRGTMAGVGQQPWIQNLTLRDNIVFGGKFERKYYNRILEGCALVKDLATLPQGDSTEIGEKGINLSGGQKARVALARAVYQNRDIYLLDDPLSAVDSHVGKHIFEEFGVYMEYIRSATIITSSFFIFFFVCYSAFQLLRGVWLSACFFGAMVFLVISGLRASSNLHTPLLQNLLRSPMSFFDTTPVGRILNRLGKDIDTIDQLLPLIIRYFVYSLQNVVATLIIIVVSTPVFALVIIPLAAIYYHFYVPTSRQLKRMESVYRSPIYQHFSETIQGVACVRAFGKDFCHLSDGHLDRFTRCKYYNIISNRWLAVRLEFIGNCVVLFAALFAVLSQYLGTTISAGIAGLSITYALNVSCSGNILCFSSPNGS